MKLNVAVAGFGNLGKSLKQHILQQEDMNLLGVFSRRRIDDEYFVPYKHIGDFANKVDVVLMAQGSYCDIDNCVHHFAHFHTVDSFDTHGEIEKHKQLLQDTKDKCKISVCAVGWDPGLLSLQRALFGMAGGQVATFWGEGISQGHSHAVRSIAGVLDAVEVTQPKAEAIEQLKRGQHVPENMRHRRLCYVACAQSDRQRIEEEIRNMPRYFAGQEVVVEFCTVAEVAKQKLRTHHAGRCLCAGEGYAAEMSLWVDSNTDFTAKIMLAYARAIPQMVADGICGALDPLDIAPKYLASKSVV